MWPSSQQIASRQPPCPTSATSAASHFALGSRFITFHSIAVENTKKKHVDDMKERRGHVRYYSSSLIAYTMMVILQIDYTLYDWPNDSHHINNWYHRACVSFLMPPPPICRCSCPHECLALSTRYSVATPAPRLISFLYFCELHLFSVHALCHLIGLHSVPHKVIQYGADSISWAI